MKSLASNLGGIFLTIVAMAMMTGHDVIIKLDLSDLSAAQIILLRNILSCILFLIWILALGQWRSLVYLKNFSVQLRSFITGSSTAAYVIAVVGLPLADLRAVIMSMPLMLTAGGAILLSEKVSWRDWCAVIIGFVGVLTVIRPSMEDTLTFYFLSALTCAFMGAMGQLMVRGIPHSIPILILALASCLWGCAVGAAFWFFDNMSVSVPLLPPRDIWQPLFIATLLFCLGGYGITFSFRYADASALAPSRYTSVVWALLADIIIWSHWPDGFSILGSTLVIGAGLYILHQQNKKMRKKKLADTSLIESEP